MGKAVARKLIFRVGGIGFSLVLDAIVEICPLQGAVIDPRHSDLSHGIIGVWEFRKTRIPVVDPCIKLNLRSAVPTLQKTVLVLKSAEGNWGLLIDQVDDIVAAQKMQPCELPPLLKATLLGCFSNVELQAGEPLVDFEPQRYYGAPQ